MIKHVLVLFFVVFSSTVQAQFIKEKTLNVQAGYGITVPDESVAIIRNGGVFAQADLVLKVKSWFELRPYAGVLLTNSNGEDVNGFPTVEKAETKAFLLGGKARLRAPIPWVAPFVELGIGASVGKFETFTFFNDIDKSGVIAHFPVTIGLELGKQNNVDIAFIYYYQPSVKQVSGAIAVGVTFPLK